MKMKEELGHGKVFFFVRSAFLLCCLKLKTKVFRACFEQEVP